MTGLRYGVVGLGPAGLRLARGLLDAGLPTVVHDLDPALAADPVAGGARWQARPEDLAGRVDAVFTCLPSPAVTETVLGRLLPALPAGAVWIETGALRREDLLRLSAQARARGVDTLETRRFAGERDARLLVGGRPELVARHRTALAALGGDVLAIGPLGAAAAMATLCAMASAVRMQVWGEAMMLARRGGLNLDAAGVALAAGRADGAGGEGTLDALLADLGSALALGRDLAVPLDLGAQAFQTAMRAALHYGLDAPSARLVGLLEDTVRLPLGAPPPG